MGSPGFFQGFNTGVALYNLAAMRASQEWGNQADPNKITSLAEKYMITGTVGDQDWLTVLGWEKPELFHLLPCQFNVQLDQNYNNTKWADVWDIYHSCPNTTLIL